MRELLTTGVAAQYIEEITLDYKEFVRQSPPSTTGKYVREYYSQGGTAGAGYCFGTIVFEPASYDKDGQITEKKFAIDNWIKNMGSISESFVWTRLPFRNTAKRTPATTGQYRVASQATDTDDNLVTTIASWPELLEGMWVNIGSQPLKTRYVAKKISNTQFIFHPQDRMPAGIMMQAASEIWIRKDDYDILRDQKVVQTAEFPSPQVSFNFREVTEAVM